MSDWFNYRPRCDMCGRFVAEGAPGVSWSQSWGYDTDGTPDLRDTELRCSPCTDVHGIKPTNCNEEQGKYHGRNPLGRAAAETSRESGRGGMNVLTHIELRPFYKMLDESIQDKDYMLCSIGDGPPTKVWLITGQQYARARTPTREEWLAGIERRIAEALREEA